jgi:tetratricopeptide (TPR) repeat protein
MIRLNGRTLTLVALLALPTAAVAQKAPPDTKQTKDAEKFIGLAMMRPNPEQKRPFYEQALKPLQEGIAKTPDNAKVWFMAGQVYVGLGQFLSADSAFKKAVQLYPGYAEDVEGEREVAWVEAFNAGLAEMDKKNNDEAIKQLELAELMYPHRPEAKMNLGALYAGKNETDKAVKIFEAAIASTNGPLKEKLKPEDAANWKRYADMASLNIAQILGSAGVEQFQAEKWDEAIASFTRAMQINPHSRDYIFNLAQSYYAKAGKSEDERAALLAQAEELTKAKKTAEAKAKTDEAQKFAPTLLPLYSQIIELGTRTLQMDPANESLYMLIARSQKLTGDMSDPAQKSDWQNKALATFTKRDELVFEVAEVSVGTNESEATVRGTVKNRKAAPGSPLKIKVTLLGINGSPVGQQEITVAAPAAEQTADFENKVAVTGEVAGWKYEVVK